MTTPVLKKEYLDMIPEFSGEPTLLNRFITICDKIVAKFYVSSNPDDFQNEYLYSTILSKIKPPALDVVVSSSSYAWPDVRQTLVASYLDKRDCFTLNLEMSQLKQKDNETPFEFYEKIQHLLNLQIAYFVNKESAIANVLSEYARKLALRVLLRGLQEPIGSLMRTKNPNSLAEALSMLTNDFQFKIKTNNNKKFIDVKNSNNFKPRPQWWNQVQNHLPMNQSPARFPHQYPNLFARPQYTNQNQNFNNRFPHNQNNVPRPYVPHNPSQQPTPMSISTRHSREVTTRNPKLNQMTGRNFDNNQPSTSQSGINHDTENFSEFEDINLGVVPVENNLLKNKTLDENHFLG